MLRVLLHVKTLGVSDVAGVAGFPSATCMLRKFKVPCLKFKVADLERRKPDALRLVTRSYAWLRLKRLIFLCVNGTEVPEGSNPVQGCGDSGREPRVGPSSQPWALRHNAVGVARKAEIQRGSSSAEGYGGRRSWLKLDKVT